MKNYIFNKDIFNQISFIFQFILQNYEEGKIKSKTNSPVTNKNKEQPILKEIPSFNTIFNNNEEENIEKINNNKEEHENKEINEKIKKNTFNNYFRAF